MSEPAPDSPRPPVAAAVIVKNGALLLVRRRVKEGSLSWQFPAGEVEPGEPASEAAVRETFEETGLTVSADRVLGQRVHPATGRTVVYAACSVVSGDAHVKDNEELVELAWVKHDELAEYVPYPFYDPVQHYLDDVLTS
ncbi:NUDIX hydrolase [Kibdelosporangium phytohabitans]|uniref:NUDIX hydrolase n=1 Tax=Kibdelosporangium phytohabitans TaxID=860235 RepID=UPI0009F88A9E|nr:NUDIX hydrolase [Kibdelosporangium phytohabitans]MBE1465702.1 8-oxo-dGTP diphosphatase [Kibdelosporangium phytohabitans]